MEATYRKETIQRVNTDGLRHCLLDAERQDENARRIHPRVKEMHRLDITKISPAVSTTAVFRGT